MCARVVRLVESGQCFWSECRATPKRASENVWCVLQCVCGGVLVQCARVYGGVSAVCVCVYRGGSGLASGLLLLALSGAEAGKTFSQSAQHEITQKIFTGGRRGRS